MSLRQKTLLIISITLVGLIVLLYSIAQIILLNSYMALEQQDTIQNMYRAVNALTDNINFLSRTLADWSYWDDTYNYIQHPYDGFVDANLTDSTLVNLNVHLMMFVNSSGEVVQQKAISPRSGHDITPPANAAKFFLPRLLQLDSDNLLDTEAGLILLPEGPILMTARYILDSSEEGPAEGVLIFGRYLNDIEVQKLSNTTHLTLSIRSIIGFIPPPEFHPPKSFPPEENSFFVSVIDDQTIRAYTVLQDINGEMAAVMQLDLPRTIYNQGKNSVYYLVSSLLIGGLVFGAVMVGQIEFFVLSPVERLHHTVKQIHSGSDLALRVPTEGKDELAGLAAAINEMLADLEQSQKKLENLNTELETHVAVRTAELQHRKTFLQTILDTMAEGVVYGTVSHVHYVNRTLSDATGYSTIELIGKPYTLLLKGANATWEPQSGEMQVVRKDGSIFSAAVIATSFRDQNNEPGYILLVRDITQEKALQAQKDRFIAHASHELRTPVTNLMTRLYLMRRKPEALDQHLEVLDNVVGRMKNLLEDLLSVSRFSSGTVTFTRQPVLLQALVNDVIEVQRSEAEVRDIRLETVVPIAPICVSADPKAMIQVITNLVVNAVNYTPENGHVVVKIQVETHDTDQYAVLSVCDNGVGIDPANLTQIFQPFFRATEGEVKGTGLGLTIVKEIVDLHGGEIIVESSPGHGSTFRVKMPLLQNSDVQAS